MGQAKRRGTYEQRLEQAKLAQQIIDKAFPDKRIASRVLTERCNSNRLAFAGAIIQKQKDERQEFQTT